MWLYRITGQNYFCTVQVSMYRHVQSMAALVHSIRTGLNIHMYTLNKMVHITEVRHVLCKISLMSWVLYLIAELKPTEYDAFSNF